MLSLIESTQNNQARSSFLVSSQLQAFTLVFILFSGGSNRRRLLSPNSRWWKSLSQITGGLESGCPSERFGSSTIYQGWNSFPLCFVWPQTKADSLPSHKVSRAAHTEFSLHGRENSSSSKHSNMLPCPSPSEEREIFSQCHKLKFISIGLQRRSQVHFQTNHSLHEKMPHSNWLRVS